MDFLNIRTQFRSPERLDSSSNDGSSSATPMSVQSQQRHRGPLHAASRPVREPSAMTPLQSDKPSTCPRETLVVIRLPNSAGRRKSVSKVLNSAKSLSIEATPFVPVPSQPMIRPVRRNLSADAIPFRPMNSSPGPCSTFRDISQVRGYSSPPGSRASSSANSLRCPHPEHCSDPGRRFTPSNGLPPTSLRPPRFPDMGGEFRSHLAQNEPNGSLTHGLYDPYVTNTTTLANPALGTHQASINPYAQDTNTTGGAAYYQTPSYAQPIQYHLYSSLGPHRENLLPYQRTAHDFFIPDGLREELQRKSAATLQTLPSTYSFVTTPYMPFMTNGTNTSRLYIASTDRTLSLSRTIRHNESEERSSFWIS